MGTQSQAQSPQGGVRGGNCPLALKNSPFTFTVLCVQQFAVLDKRKERKTPHGHLRTTRLDTKRKEKVTPVHSQVQTPYHANFVLRFFFFFPYPSLPFSLVMSPRHFFSLSLKKNTHFLLFSCKVNLIKDERTWIEEPPGF